MDFMQLFYSITGFLDRGGVVLYWIAGAATVLWFLLFERIIYIHFRAEKEINMLSSNWTKYVHHIDAPNIRKSFQDIFEHKLLFTLPLIKTLVQITPLLGLFGTVYGMVEIFDVIALQGTGDARALANGISMATLPTMTGMAVAIIGLLFLRHIEVSASRKLNLLNAELGNETY